MKALVLSLVAVSLAACSTAAQDSALRTDDGGDELRKVYTFSRDDRPVDGMLKEIKMTEDAQGKWSVSLRTAFYDRLNGKAVDGTEELGSAMSCKFLQGFVPGLVRVLCERDDRPVDGVQTIVELTKVDGSGLDARFDASMKKAWVNRMTGENAEKIEELAQGLKQQSLIALPPQPIFCTAIAGVLWNPETKTCESFTNGCQQSAMLAAGYTAIPEGQSCSL